MQWLRSSEWPHLGLLFFLALVAAAACGGERELTSKDLTIVVLPKPPIPPQPVGVAFSVQFEPKATKPAEQFELKFQGEYRTSLTEGLDFVDVALSFSLPGGGGEHEAPEELRQSMHIKKPGPSQRQMTVEVNSRLSQASDEVDTDRGMPDAPKVTSEFPSLAIKLRCNRNGKETITLEVVSFV